MKWQFQKFPSTAYKNLPQNPGVYKFLNKKNKIIYVGKAKNLKKRVTSYFLSANTQTFKTKKLISEICYIEFVIVNTEYDALFLENILIKNNQPKYNVLMKDGKSYPFICITKEHFPRVFATRNRNDDKAEHFGPFTNVNVMYKILNLIKKLYHIRTCPYNLSPKNIETKKHSVCLEYHINNCLGPCEGKQKESDYLEDIAAIRNLLKGKLSLVKNFLKDKRETAISELRYEDAHELTQNIKYLDKFESKSLIVNSNISNTDVFTIKSEKDIAFINYLKIEEGLIILSETIEVKRKLEESDSELLGLLIFDLRKHFNSQNQHILTNITIKTWENIDFSIPKIGDKKKLIDLSLKNVAFYIQQKASKNQISYSADIVALKKDLSLPILPYQIECFDNSNIQGTTPVAAMVCFINGKPSKKNYRKFNIKTVEGPDDFASMQEVVYRRYQRQLKEKKPLPNLIIIDGGKGQLSSACDALQSLDLYGKISIIGIAKNLEEVFFPQDSIPFFINKKSPSLKLIQKIRNEAHRFAITFHRNKRVKNQTFTELQDLKGVGNKTINLLLKEYKSYQRIKHAKFENLKKLIGEKKAQIIKKGLH